MKLIVGKVHKGAEMMRGRARQSEAGRQGNIGARGEGAWDFR